MPDRYRDVMPSEGPVGWSYITGPVGVGKTALACSMARRFVEDETWEAAPGLWCPPAVRFMTGAGYLEAVRGAHRGDDQALSVARGCHMLVLDDLGQESPTTWACEQLFELVSVRWNAGRVTVVTSQYAPESIAGRMASNGGREVAEALSSRLMGDCRLYRIGGGDRRVA